MESGRTLGMSQWIQGRDWDMWDVVRVRAVEVVLAPEAAKALDGSMHEMSPSGDVSH